MIPLAVSACFGAFCFWYRYLSYRGFNNDHYVHLAKAQQVLLGESPIRDFLEPGLPLSVLLSALPQAVFGHSLFAEAVLVFGCLGLAAALTCWILVRLTGSYVMASVLTLFQILIFPRTYSFPKLLLYPIAVMAIGRYARAPGIGSAVLLAVLTVVSFLMRYDHGLFIGAGCAVAMAAVHWKSGLVQTVRPLARYALATAAMLLPYLIYIQWAAGLPFYVRDAVAFSRMESQHYPVRVPTFDIDPDTALTFERPEATIHIEWAAGVGASEREALERRFEVVPDAFLDGRTWRYRIGRVSRASIERIVRHPSVEDTNGIDRNAYAVRPDRFADACIICVAPGPGLHLTENAEAWLYFLPWAAAAAGAWLVLAQASSVMPVAAALTVMTALAASTFLRTALSARLPDIWGLVPLLLGLVLIEAQRMPGYRVTARLISAALLVVTAGAVAVVGNAREELSTAGLTEGVAEVTARFQQVTESLSPPASPRRDAEYVGQVLVYLAACTTPSDRVLAFGFMPELFYVVQRGFAAGYPTFVEGHHASEAVQRFGIARWRAQSVPFAVAYERDYPVMAASFPLIAEELERRYAPVHKAAAVNDRGSLIVLAERNRRVEGTYAPLGTPCFTE